MKKDLRYVIFGAALVMALCLSAFASRPAYADEATPPPDGSPTQPAPTEVTTAPDATTTDPATTVAPTDPAPTETATEVAPTDVPPTDVAPTDAAPTDTATEAAPTEAAPTGPSAPSDNSASLSQLPEGTTVVVLDQSGQSVPLASQQAADIIAKGDPMWCPAGVVPGAASCSSLIGANTSFQNVINWLANPSNALLAKAGTIWIESSYNSTTNDGGSSSFTLDGAALPGNWANFSLTLQGGWSGLANMVVNHTVPSSTFTVPLTITGWNADVTLNDLVFATTGTGLTVSTKGKITLNHVRAQGNTGAGASLNNASGTGAVLVTSSAFNGNGADGLDVQSRGAITLTSVVANGNTGMGATLDNHTAVLPQTILLTGMNLWMTDPFDSSFSSFDNSFSKNGTDGVNATSLGLIAISNLTASGNGTGKVSGSGAVLNNTAGTLGVTMTGFSVLNGNYSNGLVIDTRGAVTLSGLMANANANGDGADIDNSTATTPQNVTLLGLNSFKYNGDTGLNVLSKGLITVNSVTASGNGSGWGAFLDNTYSTNTVLKYVSLTGVNVFSDNGSSGLKINSFGAIAMANITANGNGNYGVDVNFQGLAKTAQNVTLSGVNTFNYNAYTGLRISSYGTITVSNVTANFNGSLLAGGGFGALLRNDVVGANIRGTGVVILNGANSFNGNYNSGLDVESYGGIAAGNLAASGNGHSSLDYGVFLNNVGALLSPGITVNGASVFNNNYQSGLVVRSKGAINASGLTAVANQHGQGVILDNTFTFGDPPVSGATLTSPGVIVSGVNLFTDNFATGLVVNSFGPISLSVIGLTADNNGTGHNDSLLGWGVYLNNSTAVVAKNVAVGGKSIYTDNYSGGLSVLSKGAIVVGNLTSNGNGPSGLNDGYGVYLDNTAALNTAGLGVTVSGVNTFNNNFLSGLRVLTYGAVGMSSITANGNGTVAAGGWGTMVDNSGASVARNVALVGVNVFNDNYSGGLSVNSIGVISASSLTAKDSKNGDGAVLNNSGAPAAFGVTLTGINVFHGNFGSGLLVTSKGLISASNVTATGNQNGYGASLVNTAGVNTVAALGVNLSGVNVFSDNYSTGLSVQTNGAISIASISMTANNNGIASSSGYGVLLDNHTTGPGVTKNVAIGGANTFNGNYDTGLNVISLGAITTNSITASGNGTVSASSGVNLDNSGLGAVGGVTMNGVNSFYKNGLMGLNVVSLGSILTNNLTASYNVSGVKLDNTLNGVTNPAITLNGLNTFTKNSGIGANITSNGNVSITKVSADGNTADGLYVNILKNTATLTVTCGSFTGNASNGLEWAGTNLAVLKAVYASGNTGADIVGNTTMTVRACPLP